MSNSDILVTVIIPCYNTHIHLDKCLDSLSNQKFKKFEILIIDDGSNNFETISFLDNLSQPNIRLIKQANKGLANARNTGILNARGKFILPLDTDDWVDDDHIASMYHAISKNYDKDNFVYTDTVLEGLQQGLIKNNYNFFEQLFSNQVPYSIMFPKKIAFEICGYDENMLFGYEDWDFNLRLYKNNCKPIKIEESKFHYRVAKSGMLLSKSKKIHTILWNYIILKNKNLYNFNNFAILWKEWSKKKTRYPIIFYLIWFYFYKFLPIKFANVFFSLFINISHSRRVNLNSIINKKIQI
jgi:glycosyltransferase involved in cell wall biosynthesis